MKKILLAVCCFPIVAHGGFSKPVLLARFMFQDAWNAPANTFCFGGEPVGFRERVYLNCLDADSQLMASFGKEGFKLLARTQDDHAFSKPFESFNRVNWYEFSETSSVRAYSAEPFVRKTEIRNLGPLSDSNDTFLPFSPDAFFFKSNGSAPKLWLWKNDSVSSLFDPGASYIFYPLSGPNGEIVMKTREKNLEDSSPDKLWHYQKSWRVILEDKDSLLSSPWLSFRHQVAVEGAKVVVIARDQKGEALLLLENGRVQVLAREGVELRRFDYFAPKMRAGVIVVRGEDFQGNKAVYVKDSGSFRALLTQGDIVQTDLGAGRVFYQNPDAQFYGAPGLDEKGNVYQQATLTDPDYPKTLLGIGLIKFKNE